MLPVSRGLDRIRYGSCQFIRRSRCAHCTGNSWRLSPTSPSCNVRERQHCGTAPRLVYRSITATDAARWRPSIRPRHCLRSTKRKTAILSLANGVLYACSLDANGQMYAMDAMNGAILWSHQSGGACNAGAAIAGGMVFWGSGYAALGYTPNDKFHAFTITE